MSALESTSEQSQRPPLAARFAVVGPRGTRSATVLLAALLALALALPGRTEAFVYWGDVPPRDRPTIGRANLDGTGATRQFITLGGLSASTNGVAVDDAHVYWNLLGQIGRANLDGTGVDRSFISGIVAGAVAVDAAHVYWSDSSANGRANLDGTGVDRSFITGIDAGAVAVDAAHVYWSDSITGAIGRANLDGSGVEPSFIPNPGSSPCGVAVDDAHVYWNLGF